MAAIAGIGALGSLAMGAANAAGTASRSNAQARQQADMSAAQLAQAQNNEQYQRMIESMIQQRSVAGTQDSFGSTMQYDPNTNTWTSKLGQLPFNAQTAADQAAIERNTTDARQAQLANEVAARRATQAGPVADTALREMQSFRPMGQDQLVGLLERQATNASNASFDPLRSDMLRSFQRSGTAAGPVLAALGKQQADTLRDSLIQAQIQGMTNVGSINQSKQQALAQNAGNAATLANPQFQYAGISPSDKSATMAQAIAARAQNAAIAPAYGAGPVNEATKLGQAAGTQAISRVPGQLNTGADVAHEIGSTLTNKDMLTNLNTLGKSLFGPTTYDGSLAGSPDPSTWQISPGMSWGDDSTKSGVKEFG